MTSGFGGSSKIISSIYECGVQITQDINPLYIYTRLGTQDIIHIHSAGNQYLSFVH